MLKIEELSVAEFQEFGTFLDPNHCGEAMGGNQDPLRFYPDRMLMQFSAANLIALSPLVIEPRPLVILSAELHYFTEEVLGGFTEDVCFHVGKAGDAVPPVKQFRVFRLPAGWWIRLKRGVWHEGPFVLGTKATYGMVILPPHTYTNDCHVFTLSDPIKIQS